MENHLTRRKELIELERSKGHTAHRTYSPKELRVNEIIHSLRLEEGDTDDDSWRGMPYNARSKAKMQKSRLFGALRRINKGCALHLHLDACGTTQGLVDLAFEQDTLCIESDLPFVGPSFPESALFTFSYHPPSSPLFSNPTPTLYTPSYIPHTPVPLKIVRANYPESLGGPKGFDEMVKRRLVVDPSSTGWSPKRVWDQFQSIFNLSGGLLGFEPVWEACSSIPPLLLFNVLISDWLDIEQVLRIYIADKVPYLEARINFLPEFMTSISGSPTFAHADWIRSFQRIVTKLRLEFPDRFYGAKIIYSTIRIVPPGHLDPATKSKSGLESTIAGGLRWYLEDCLALRREFGELICGFDLVGWEDGLRPLMDYMEDLLWFKEQEGRVPFLFHAGETNGDGNRADLVRYARYSVRSCTDTLSIFTESLRCDSIGYEEDRTWRQSCSTSCSHGFMQRTSNRSASLLPSPPCVD